MIEHTNDPFKITLRPISLVNSYSSLKSVWVSATESLSWPPEWEKYSLYPPMDTGTTPWTSLAL